MLGYLVALIEIVLWFSASLLIRRVSKTLMNMNTLTYYWFTFMILTGFWETIFITNYHHVSDLASNLIETNTHVWFRQYDLSYILPWKFSEIFYAEYAAYADREYMSSKDSWSHFIEGSHCALVSLFCVITLLCGTFKGLNSKHFTFSMGGAMVAQFMNSFLYMAQYGIQTKTQYSVNFDTEDFPLGSLWHKRPFMYVNLPWMIFPGIITLIHLLNKDSDDKKKSYLQDDMWTNRRNRNYNSVDDEVINLMNTNL